MILVLVDFSGTFHGTHSHSFSSPSRSGLSHPGGGSMSNLHCPCPLCTCSVDKERTTASRTVNPASFITTKDIFRIEVKIMQKISQWYLLESDIEVKCDWLSRITDHWYTVLMVRYRGASYQLHGVCSRIVSYLLKAKERYGTSTNIFQNWFKNWDRANKGKEG